MFQFQDLHDRNDYCEWTRQDCELRESLDSLHRLRTCRAGRPLNR